MIYIILPPSRSNHIERALFLYFFQTIFVGYIRQLQQRARCGHSSWVAAAYLSLLGYLPDCNLGRRYCVNQYCNVIIIIMLIWWGFAKYMWNVSTKIYIKIWWCWQKGLWNGATSAGVEHVRVVTPHSLRICHSQNQKMPALKPLNEKISNIHF